MDDADTNLLNQVFYAYSQAKIAEAAANSRSFVHYTSTEAAISIISKKEIWLRNSGVMNDFSEMAHGEACLRFCLIENPEISTHSREVLDSVREGLHDQTVAFFMNTIQLRRHFTYLLSISEHGPEVLRPGMIDQESQFGRLSMWRAYGARGGIALIFDREPIVRPNDALNVTLSPVFYGNPPEVGHLYSSMLFDIERNIDHIRRIDPDTVWLNLQRFVHFSSLATKHPGFKEEREWRITYSADPTNEHIEDADFNLNNNIKREFCAINGLPQRIYKIPFVDHPDQGLEGIALPSILRHVIVGPTQYPVVVADAVSNALRRAGFTDQQISIAISQIPLRT